MTGHEYLLQILPLSVILSPNTLILHRQQFESHDDLIQIITTILLLPECRSDDSARNPDDCAAS
jgi:hypothetical protein